MSNLISGRGYVWHVSIWLEGGGIIQIGGGGGLSQYNSIEIEGRRGVSGLPIRYIFFREKSLDDNNLVDT